MSQTYAIHELHESDRPRERLRLRGPQSLSDAELIAIVLGTGTAGESVIELSRRMLIENGGLIGLMRLDLEELELYKGLGPAKATKLKATMEIARRVLAQSTDPRGKITSPDDVIKLVELEMTALEQEELRVAVLDSKHCVMAIKTIYKGSVNQAQVRIGELFKDAVRQHGVAIILMHNHPSGDPTPSSADVAVTADAVRAGELLNIEVLDHLIIGRGRHVSLRRLGLGFSAHGQRT